jgi:hypothetical protein
LQKLNDRSPFSEEVVISSSLKKDKKGVMQSTKLILGISNWHFNRDTQHLAEGPKCKLEDINLSFKLASTAFNVDEAGASTSAASKEQQLKYDRNGVTVPYAAFCSLMEQSLFFDYIDNIKEQYEKYEGEINKSSPEIEETDNRKDNEIEEEEETIGKKRQKRGKNLTDSEDEEEGDPGAVEELISTESNQQNQKHQQILSKTSTRRGSKKSLLSTPPHLPSSPHT